MMDRKLLALSRTWCLYEVWAFVYYDDIRKIKICMPGGSRSAGLVDLQAWWKVDGGGPVEVVPTCEPHTGCSTTGNLLLCDRPCLEACMVLMYP